MINSVESQQFALLFMGKNNTYVKNMLPKEKPEAGTKIKTEITNNEGKVDSELLNHHLDGDFGVGICPVDAEGKCRFSVLDIDCYDERINKMLYFIREYQLPFLPFRSKSGGLHVYIFYKKAVSAKNVRELLTSIIYFLSLDVIYGKNKVEIFPKQDKANGFGSSITLPYFNAENAYTYLMDLDGNKVPFSEALSVISKKMTTMEDIKSILADLPYSDAPPCIQKVLLGNLVGSEDSGRNNFLFSFGVYAKKKYGAGFEDYVKEINESFECPLEDTVVEGICNSVRSNEYVYRCKDIPCNAFCNKPDCRKREYGLSRDKGHFTGVDYGQLYRYNTAEPYYIWKLRLQGQEEFKDVIFKDEGFLLDQRNFAKMCVRYLNQAPMQVGNNDWYAILNSVLPNIIDVEVKAEVDTSSTAIVRNAFISYLANKQSRRDSPYQIRTGLCVYQKKDGKGKFYFTHQGFVDYLNNIRIKYDLSMLGETLKSFGAVPDTLVYYNTLGEERSCSCWSKEEDELINEVYCGAIEVEQSDKASQGVVSISEASNKDMQENNPEIKPYSKEDFDNASQMF